jgi:Protein of unknown function (DUF2829)
MDFSQALAFIKVGRKMKRRDWHYDKMFIVFQKGYPNGIGINKNTSEALNIPEGTIIKFAPYLMICINDNYCNPWVPNQSDLLTDDWEEVK